MKPGVFFIEVVALGLSIEIVSSHLKKPEYFGDIKGNF